MRAYLHGPVTLSSKKEPKVPHWIAHLTPELVLICHDGGDERLPGILIHGKKWEKNGKKWEITNILFSAIGKIILLKQLNALTL